MHVLHVAVLHDPYNRFSLRMRKVRVAIRQNAVCRYPLSPSTKIGFSRMESILLDIILPVEYVDLCLEFGLSAGICTVLTRKIGNTFAKRKDTQLCQRKHS